MKKLIVGVSILAVLFGLAFVRPSLNVSAGDKTDLCHNTGSGSNPWVVQSVNANEVQSHIANGDFLYQGPYKSNGHPDNQDNADGIWCQQHSGTPSPTATATPTPTPTPEDCHGEGEKACPTATPTPTEAPSNPGNNIGGPGDGLSDGRSDGRSSCPECTAPPKTSGQVLGATTDFAGTGVMEHIIMNVVGAIGGLSTAAGMILKKRNTK